jgi:hypothetical protein
METVWQIVVDQRTKFLCVLIILYIFTRIVESHSLISSQEASTDDNTDQIGPIGDSATVVPAGTPATGIWHGVPSGAVARPNWHDAEPGVFITGRVRKLACSFPNQQYVLVKGLHFIQEDSPNEIGQAINNWLEQGQS